MLRTLNDHIYEITGKRVVVRCNFDVPIVAGKVQDTTRIEDCWETLRLLLEHGCQVCLLAHYDRPQGKVDLEKSLRPVAEVLETMVGETVGFAERLDAEMVKSLPARVVLGENLRFWPGEEDNDQEFVSELAGLGDFYVNEAFADCHRRHASIVGLPKKLPGAAGLHLAREIRVLSQVRNSPEHPLVVVIGGAKLETKEPIIETFLPLAETILVGGRAAMDLSRKHQFGDHVLVAELDESQQDITESSAKRFAEKILQAKTVIWNGTMGVFEDPSHRQGTKIVAEAIDQTQAFTVVGGGDTETALTNLDLEHNIDHLSSGGGAMLEFLVKGTLPGLEALGYGKDG